MVVSDFSGFEYSDRGGRDEVGKRVLEDGASYRARSRDLLFEG